MRILGAALVAAISAGALLAGGGGAAEAQQRWQQCASEDGFCRVPYPTVVRYGARGYFETRRAGPPGIPCNNSVFGDPIGGVRKACAFVVQDGNDDDDDGPPPPRGGGYGPPPGGGYGPPPGYGGGGGFQICAEEGDYCRVGGTARVRYGARGRFVFRTVRGGIPCTNEAFGTDPAVGVTKTCAVER